MMVLSEKIEYLGNGTIFFETACAEIHQTPAPTNLYRNESNRFPSIEQGRSWLTRNGS